LGLKLLHFACRFFFIALVFSGCAWAVLPAKQIPSHEIPKQLKQLASQAKTPIAWNALRRFAKSAAGPETQGMAWFVLGYHEFAAGKFIPALKDLRAAAETNFSLSEFAQYYEARAARASEQPQAGVSALRDFSSRYPQSILRVEAVDLLAELLIESNQAAQAVDLLSKDPAIHSSSLLLLRLGDALSQVGQLQAAARTDEELYCSFPTTSQAQKAHTALRELRRRLGASFPPPSTAQRSRRAAILFREGRYRAALKEYTSLSEESGSDSSAPDWTVARARCLFYLRRYEQASQILSIPLVAHPQQDAARLETLVNILAHEDNERGMAAALNDLGKRYPTSPDYGVALTHAGFYYARRGNWKAAAPYYQMAASGFPNTPAGEEAAWKTAWYSYLAGNSGGAATQMADFVLRYPASLHVPAALFWLGKIAQDNSQATPARAYFSALIHRYPQRYYASLARNAMAALPMNTPATPASLPSSGEPEAAKPQASSAASLGAMASVLRAIPPLQGTRLVPCHPMPVTGVMRDYQIFHVLGLDDLAVDYLHSAAAALSSPNPWIFLALAQADYAGGRATAALFAARHAVPDYEDFEFDALPREMWDYLYPRSYWSLARADARSNHLDPYLVMAVIRQESAFNPKALSGAGAVGLMQMLPETVTPRLRGYRRRLMVRRLENPAYNLRQSTHYLRRLLAAFGGNTAEALAAYNAGDVRVRRWLDGNNFRSPQEFLETTPFADTRAYVEAILRDVAIYRQLLSGTARFAPCDLSSPPAPKAPFRRHRRR
jgi:soluble lytic murein transglycosylase